MVRDGDEVVAARPRVRIDEVLRHVQIPAGGHHRSLTPAARTQHLHYGTKLNKTVCVEWMRATVEQGGVSYRRGKSTSESSLSLM